MTGALWLLPALPLAGFLVLLLAGRRMPPRAIAAIGAGSVGLAAVDALVLAARYRWGHPLRETLWTWMAVDGVAPRVALHLDGLSLTMVLVVTVVGFLVHLYATEYMRGAAPHPTGCGDDGYARFFAEMNLFVASMLVLVLASDLLLLFLGWEGVGLCSYLLIGFWYQDPANVRAANKAFMVTRVGDAAMALGLFLLVTRLGTFDLPSLMSRVVVEWPPGSAVATVAALLLLAGAVGKSAQLPLQTWLPDAMAGPTPVSALIHAATMVTAGVYLVARTHALYAIAPVALGAVAVVGAVTLLLAGMSALAQRDLKRVLAYSTMSQIGLMFVALGVGAYTAALLHLVVHAFCKAALFLAAGAVIGALGGENDVMRMGGLRRRMPLVFWTFTIAAASLAGLPLVTAGFYSKELILAQAFMWPHGGLLLWLAALIGSLFTSLYLFRVVFLVFFLEPEVHPTRRGAPRRHDGEEPTGTHGTAGPAIQVPLVVLAALSILAALLLPPIAGLLRDGLPGLRSVGSEALVTTLESVGALVSITGIGLAYLAFGRGRTFDERLPLVGGATEDIWASGFGFDALYELLFVWPVVWFARVNRTDRIDAIFDELAALVRDSHAVLRRTQTGRLRAYAGALAAGALILVSAVVLGWS